MSEKLKDTAIDLLLDGVKKKIDDMRDNHKWQELFVNTGHFFINNSDMVTRLESICRGLVTGVLLFFQYIYA